MVNSASVTPHVIPTQVEVRRPIVLVWVAPILGALATGLIYAPILWLMLMSFSKDPLSGWPESLRTSWYESLFHDLRWYQPLQESIILAALVGLACMTVATIVARSLLRMRRRGVLLIVFLIPLLVPGIVMGTALFLYIRSFLNLPLGNPTMFIGHFIWAFPFSLIAVLITASRFDGRLLEAAADLGASSWQAFWDIELPILKPGIICAAIFGFLLSFNELPRSIYLRGEETSLPLYVWAQAASHTSTVPLVYALNTLILVITIPIISWAFWILLILPTRSEVAEKQ